jgi:hypothetical protein
MLKRLLYFSLFIFRFSFTHAQTWEPVGKGIGATDTTMATVHTMCVYSNKLYVGGAFVNAGGLVANNIASWNGKKWDTLSTGVRVDEPEHESVQVNALCVYRNMLCVAGYFDYAGRHINYFSKDQPMGVSGVGGGPLCIALWADTINTKPDWFGIGGIGCPFEGSITSLCIYNDDLYIGGEFDGQIPKYNIDNIVRWNLYNGWSGLLKKEAPLPDAEGDGYTPGGIAWNFHPFALTVFNGKLYIGGNNEIMGGGGASPDTRISPTEKVSTWDDTTFHAIAKSILKKGLGDIKCMVVYDSALYVGCHYDVQSNTYGIMKYDGKNWSIFQKEAWTGMGSVFAMTVWNNKLYIGGRFDNIAGIPVYNVACWDGKQFSAVGAGFQKKDKLNSFVHALCVYNNELYAGGFLFSSAGKPMMNIAKLNLNNNPPKKKGMQTLGK